MPDPSATPNGEIAQRNLDPTAAKVWGSGVCGSRHNLRDVTGGYLRNRRRHTVLREGDRHSLEYQQISSLSGGHMGNQEEGFGYTIQRRNKGIGFQCDEQHNTVREFQLGKDNDHVSDPSAESI